MNLFNLGGALLSFLLLFLICCFCWARQKVKDVESKCEAYYDELNEERRKSTEAFYIHETYHKDRCAYITKDKGSSICENSFALNWVDPFKIISICLPRECSVVGRYDAPKIELIDKENRLVLLSNEMENFYIVSIDKRTVVPVSNKIISTLLNKDDK